ncbi:MAG: hypothetical protein A3H99_04020 [Gallionellales bacterium RIFCSPLOWO2_02_FULL_59_110]|nr:MAG: hypothetical protein A3H99_04020 [Gallionellales bacterium RIFCSPLOWO2_02_FULL_59_110]OGT05465.1 MAG: hypothetical protein A2Z65_09480 [Gallionellales bacterium RIFCSPLOWO2_02_58_13]
MDDFPQRLKEAIDSTNQSVNKFSKEIGVSEGTVRNWIAGKGEPDLSDLLKIIAATGTTFEWLSSGSDKISTRISQSTIEFPLSPALATRISEAVLLVYGVTYSAMDEEIKISLFRNLYASIALLLGGGEIATPPNIDEIKTMLKLAIKYGKAPAPANAADTTDKEKIQDSVNRAIIDANLKGGSKKR